MKGVSRRGFFRIGGLGMAGLAMSRFGAPLLSSRQAFAFDSGAAWRFGVMADTQWRTGSNAGGEPASCATTIIDVLNQQFMNHGCRFVIQVGDLVDVESVSGVRSLPTRRLHADALYGNGIGFFPVRGNHEASATAAAEMRSLFPHTIGSHPLALGADNFTSPVLPATTGDPAGVRLKGLSYSFDYENVRCVLIDQFTRLDGSGSTNNNAVDQVEWVESALSSNPSDRHAFVFSHKNLIGQNHKDVLFGGNLTANAGSRDAFISSLWGNGVRYHMSGHDHMHHRSIVRASSDPAYRIGQIICSSNSYKFYTPAAGDDGRETPLCQELFTVGYYIVTVDGPRVTVDFYSSSHGHDYGDYDLVYPPTMMNFHLRETFGYSLNGKGFEVARGESYDKVIDSFEGTTARIIAGVNANQETDRVSRPLFKDVNTGWSRRESIEGAASHALSLWGISDNLSLYDSNLAGLLPSAPESRESDAYTLALTYDPRKVRPSQLVGGRFKMASYDPANGWINSVDMNYGGVKSFKYGPWRSDYGLGTYGVDPTSSTVWAVVNHDGVFAAKM